MAPVGQADWSGRWDEPAMVVQAVPEASAGRAVPVARVETAAPA
ncbi:hypothetical protein BZL30_8344 [Mycobacterium kansasii]|uniref:Uncharacterized protein n=1 Tax=Mycobacterium kansasii TaxID=1768 RepID=A0A1V3WI01_MYCKA|nr:hypothetical protein BZL30_8344 [Mycobacterium kansasii]